MDEIPKWGKRQERENEREIEACCFWPQKVVERGRCGDRGKRAVHTDGAAGLSGDMLQQSRPSCERCGISGKIAFYFSISIEMLQLLFRLGTFQLSDIFYNTVGGALGGLLYYVAMKARKRL